VIWSNHRLILPIVIILGLLFTGCNLTEATGFQSTPTIEHQATEVSQSNTMTTDQMKATRVAELKQQFAVNATATLMASPTPTPNPTHSFSPTPTQPITPSTQITPLNNQILEQVRSAVVQIKTSAGVASGTIITPDGYILTNWHVIAGNDSVDVTVPEMCTRRGEVIGYDDRLDLAVVKIAGEGWPFLPISSSPPSVSESVFIIGYNKDLEDDSNLYRGNIDSLHTEGQLTWLQTDVTFDLGTSGGAAVNSVGDFIGIPTIRTADEEDVGHVAALFSVPDEIRDLAAGSRVSSPIHVPVPIASPLPASPLAAGRIEFVSDRDVHPQIFVTNGDESDATRLITNFKNDNNTLPRWSPDHTKVAFVSWEENGNPDLYVMNSNGSGLMNVTSSRAYDHAPSWSPDGSRIAFESNREESGDSAIYVMNADGSNVHRLIGAPTFGGPWWSPEGELIAFISKRTVSSYNNIYVSNLDGSKVTMLTKVGHNGGFQWSPDGTKILFTREYNWDGLNEIWVMNADGSGMTKLTEPSRAQRPTWSPDGTEIVFYSDRTDRWDIFRINADGSELTRLTNEMCGSGFNPVWSPDGTQIAFESYRDGNYEVYVMDADGSNQVNVTNHPSEDKDPSWGPAVR